MISELERDFGDNCREAFGKLHSLARLFTENQKELVTSRGGGQLIKTR